MSLYFHYQKFLWCQEMEAVEDLEDYTFPTF